MKIRTSQTPRPLEMICPAISLHFRVSQKDFSHTGGNAFWFGRRRRKMETQRDFIFTEFWSISRHNRSLCGPSLVEVKENSPLIARQSTSGVILAAPPRLGAME